jgi:hypothetical protein
MSVIQDFTDKLGRSLNKYSKGGFSANLLSKAVFWGILVEIYIEPMTKKWLLFRPPICSGHLIIEK